MTVTAPHLLSLNGLFVIMLLPVLAAAWSALARRGHELAPFTKFAIGFIFFAAGFLVLVAAAWTGDSNTRISAAWIVAAYFMATVGELCIAPPALALVGRIVPVRYAGVAMGLTLLSLAVGNLLSSLPAGLASVPDTVTVADSRAAYGAFFLVPTGLAFAFAVIAAAFGFVLSKPERNKYASL